MKKIKFFFLFVLLAFFVLSANNTVNASEFLVATEDDFLTTRQENETTTIKLDADITLDNTRPELNVYNDYIIDLNGHDLYIRKFLNVWYYADNITIKFIDSSANKTGRITTNPTSNPFNIRRASLGDEAYVANFIFDGITFEQVDIVGTIFNFTANEYFNLNFKIYNSTIIVDDSILQGTPASLENLSLDIQNSTIEAKSRSVKIANSIDGLTFGDVVDTTKYNIKGIPENETILEEISADTPVTNKYEKIIVSIAPKIIRVKFDPLEYGYSNEGIGIPIKSLVEGIPNYSVQVSGQEFIFEPDENGENILKPKEGLKAGDYTAQITIEPTDSSSYAPITGTVTLTVNKKKIAKPVPVTVDASFEYDGTEKEFLVTGFDENTMITGGNKKTDAGTHSADYGIKDEDNYEWEDGTSTILSFRWYITKASLKKPEPITVTFTYDGQEKEIVVSNYDSNILSVENGIGMIPGIYSAKYTIINTNNYEWEDGTTDEVIIPWTIGKAKIKRPIANNTEFTYNGTQHELVVENYDSNVMTVENNMKTRVGVYNATFSLINWQYYEWEDGTQSDIQIEWKINKAELDKPTATVTEFDYDKTEKELVVTGFDSNTMKVENNVKTNAGDYIATFTLLDVDNYRWSDKTIEPATIEWKINKIVVNVPTAEIVEFEYDGTEKTLDVKGIDESLMSVVGISKTEPGRYTAQFDLLDKENYVWEDNRITTQTIEWVITTPEPSYKKGDINKDGLVDSADAAIALNLYKYNNATTEDIQIGDMDENGMIDSADAAMILNVFKYNL